MSGVVFLLNIKFFLGLYEIVLPMIDQGPQDIHLTKSKITTTETQVEEKEKKREKERSNIKTMVNITSGITQVLLFENPNKINTNTIVLEVNNNTFSVRK